MACFISSSFGSKYTYICPNISYITNSFGKGKTEHTLKFAQCLGLSTGVGLCPKISKLGDGIHDRASVLNQLYITFNLYSYIFKVMKTEFVQVGKNVTTQLNYNYINIKILYGEKRAGTRQSM